MELNKKVVIRRVYEKNLEAEFRIIRKILKKYPYVALDTEYPGVIIHPNLQNRVKYSHLDPSFTYFLMKTNVDALKIIQLGLTLSDAQGNLPDFGHDCAYIWEFNFKDFDIYKDLCNPDSIALLVRQGIDFLKNREYGISSARFSRMFVDVFRNKRLTWVTFHGAYDFGFLIKVLTQDKLPGDLRSFMRVLASVFGLSVYDMKQMMRYCGLHGGLESVARNFNVQRVAGNSHEAASDSLLTMQTFMKLKDVYFNGENMRVLDNITGVPYGLNLEAILMVPCM